MHRLVTILRLLVIASVAVGCGESNMVGPDDADDPAANVPLSAGSIGLVIDVRDIVKKGYFPTEAEVTFQDHAAQNAILSIDQRTNVAILRIPNDSVTDSQRMAFAAGVAARIVVRDSAQATLADSPFDRLELDDSNRPLVLDTGLPFAPRRPVVIKDAKPYLMQQEDLRISPNDQLLQRVSSRVIGTGGYDPQNPSAQHFFFMSTPDDNSYLVGDSVDPQTQRLRQLWCAATTSSAFTPPGVDARRLVFSSRCDAPADTAIVVIEQNEDGWFRLKLTSTGEYVRLDDGEVLLAAPDPITFEQASRFRVISDNIVWTIADRGTSFSQPIMPSARLEFAYQGRLTNCSNATLTETIGRAQTKTRTTTFSTSESVQLFSSASIRVGTTVGAEAGVDVAGLGEVKVTAEVSTEIEFSTSLTYATGNTIEESSSVTEEISRTREVTIPPRTAIKVSDLIRTIDNVVTPFTQSFRARGRHRDDNTALTGVQLATQLESNHFQGVITQVGRDFVDFSLRGEARTDQFFEAETTVEDVPGACS